MPPNISITEYPLPPEKNPIENDGLFQFVPTQAWPVSKPDTSPAPHKTTLEEIGYELRVVDNAEGLPYSEQLYKEGKLLLDRVTHISDVYTVPTDSDPITAFLVEVELGNENFLIQNDTISAWGGYAIYNSAPILYQEKLLWARTYSDRLEIRKSNGDIIFTFTTSWQPNHYPSFRDWNGHWILETDNSIIQDGEVLNLKLGFQEMFDWDLVKDKPTYFFRKGTKVGISYDGQILPLQYEDVAHGLCCSPGQNNPSMLDDAIQFYGKRAGVWYYVVMKFK